jgi:Spy/CpxP family protein refolding chaperone
MKKLNFVFGFLLTLCLCSFFDPNAFCQNQAPNQAGGGQNRNAQRFDPAKMVDRMMERLDKEVTLTADQKKKIRAIYEKSFKEAPKPPAASDSAKTTTDKPNSRRERLNQSKEMGNQTKEMGNRMNAINQEIEKVLTPDQVTKFRAMAKQGGGFSVDSRIERLNTTLKLTDDQKKKIRPIYEKESEKMQKMRESMQEGQDRTAMMESFRKVREETDKEMLKILTVEQQKKYKEMQEQMRQRMQNRGQQPQQQQQQ